MSARQPGPGAIAGLGWLCGVLTVLVVQRLGGPGTDPPPPAAAAPPSRAAWEARLDALDASLSAAPTLAVPPAWPDGWSASRLDAAFAGPSADCPAGPPPTLADCADEAPCVLVGLLPADAAPSCWPALPEAHRAEVALEGAEGPFAVRVVVLEAPGAAADAVRTEQRRAVLLERAAFVWGSAADRARAWGPPAGQEGGVAGETLVSPALTPAEPGG